MKWMNIVLVSMVALFIQNAKGETNAPWQTRVTNGIPVTFKGIVTTAEGERRFQLTFEGPRTFFAPLGAEVQGFTIKKYDKVPNPQHNLTQPFVHVLTIERDKVSFSITNGTTVIFNRNQRKTAQPATPHSEPAAQSPQR